MDEDHPVLPFEIAQQDGNREDTYIDKNVIAKEVHPETQPDKTQHSNVNLDFDINETSTTTIPLLIWMNHLQLPSHSWI